MLDTVKYISVLKSHLREMSMSPFEFTYVKKNVLSSWAASKAKPIQ